MDRFTSTLLLIALILIIGVFTLFTFIWICSYILRLLTFEVFDIGECQFLSVIIFIGVLIWGLEKLDKKR